MRTIYLDCGMGAAGDMLTAALLELCPEKREEFLKTMNGLELPGVRVTAEKSEKCGITGTHVEVTVFGETEESEDVHDAVAAQMHDHACLQTYSHDHEAAHESAAGCGCDHAHSHDHVHGHDHGHDHTHDCAHTHDHDHTHAYGHHHHHTGMAEILERIGGLALPEPVRRDMEAVYRLIAEAEGRVHGKTVDEIHFHEVGTADAMADIAGVCYLMYLLKPDQVLASPVHVGSGHVRCAHGILPVPAPAAADILRGIPIYGGQIKGELCTPTGAALLKHFVTGFGEMPPMTVRAIGYGMGKKDFECANCVRALLGETSDETGEIVELSCNLDDMTAEEIGFAQERLFAAGALEVYTIPIGMKKGRPGVLFACMCRKIDRTLMTQLIFRYTTTLGIRENISRRYTLSRRIEECETSFGAVRKKISSGYGVHREKYEYDDLARIAKERGISLAEVREMLGDR